MKTYNSLILTDWYKQFHYEQYNPKVNRMVSYFTPRGTRIDSEQKVTIALLQGFIKEYLIENFNETFFKGSLKKALKLYKRLAKRCVGKQFVSKDKFIDLYNLGYLPIEIWAIPEGTRVPIGCPMIQITNTHPDFMWCVNFIESLMSCEIWYPMIVANVGFNYRQVVNKWFDKTVEDNVPRNSAISEFGFRGNTSLQSAVKASSAFLLSFTKTSTIPAVDYLEEYYDCDIDEEAVGNGMVSTEHSVMCSNTAIDGNEVDFLRKLLTEIYPTGNFSAVLDSYDYYNVLKNILPTLKDEILSRKGTFFVRGDSGDIVDIVCNTVEILWDIFGGEINSKGYRVLDNHIRAIYGDSVTIEGADEIYKRLESMGFASNNVALGAGSFSMLCMKINDKLYPFTRDTFNSCVKATYCEADGKPVHIFKDPKTDSGVKKSHKGCCKVFRDKDGEISFIDGLDFNEDLKTDNLLIPVFKDGKMLKEYSLQEVRNRLHGGSF